MSWQSIDYEIMISTTITAEKCMPVLPTTSGADMNVQIKWTASSAVQSRRRAASCTKMAQNVHPNLDMYYIVEFTKSKPIFVISMLAKLHSFVVSTKPPIAE
jgi:hypothetical protein